MLKIFLFRILSWRILSLMLVPILVWFMINLSIPKNPVVNSADNDNDAELNFYQFLIDDDART